MPQPLTPGRAQVRLRGLGVQWSYQGMWGRTSLEGSVTQTGAVSAKTLAESVQSSRGWAEETEESGLERKSQVCS